MLKCIWWALKAGLFPHMDRRKVNTAVVENRRRRVPKMMRADMMLDTAIMDLAKALERDPK